MPRPNNFDANKITEYLQGTCMNSLDDVIQIFYPDMTEDDLIQKDYDFIDNEIFLCDECGWWCEICESNDVDGDNKCDDCAEEEE